MAKRKAKELTSNIMSAPAYRKQNKKGTIPLWKVWKWSLKNPGVSPFKDTE